MAGDDLGKGRVLAGDVDEDIGPGYLQELERDEVLEALLDLVAPVVVDILHAVACVGDIFLELLPIDGMLGEDEA